MNNQSTLSLRLTECVRCIREIQIMLDSRYDDLTTEEKTELLYTQNELEWAMEQALLDAEFEYEN